MADQLVTVDSDRGPIEPIPVSVFVNGEIVTSFGGVGGGGGSLTDAQLRAATVPVSPTDANGAAITQLGGIRITGPSAVARLQSSAASTNAALVRNSATRAFRITGTNNSASPRYLKLYNKASTPVVGTDFPFWVETLEASAPFVIDLAGLYFALGLGYGITTGIADSDTGAISAGDITTMNIAYL